MLCNIFFSLIYLKEKQIIVLNKSKRYIKYCTINLCIVLKFLNFIINTSRYLSYNWNNLRIC
jgi:hypothetical protein